MMQNFITTPCENVHQVSNSVFIEMFAILSSSVRHLQRSCTLLRRLKLSAVFLCHLVPWPSV